MTTSAPRRPRRLAGLAALSCLAGLLAVPGAAAAPCPSWTSQTFNGTLLPGETDRIHVYVALRGNVSFQFIPFWVFSNPFGQKVTMGLNGNSVTGDTVLAMTVHNAAPGLYAVSLRGHNLGMDGMAFLPYKLKVTETGCQAR